MDGVDCCLIGIVLGVRTTKNIPQYQHHPKPVNIAQYPITQYQYCSNPNQLVTHKGSEVDKWTFFQAMLLYYMMPNKQCQYSVNKFSVLARLLTLSVGVVAVLTMSQPAAAVRHCCVVVGVPGWPVGLTVKTHITRTINNSI